MTAPAFLLVAPNGARRGKADHPNLPLTPAEIAAEAERSLAAGASGIHLHVRDGQGRHALDPDLYRAAIAAIEARIGDRLVIQITTEAVGQFTAQEQMATIRALRPEAVSIGLREILPEGGDEAAVADLFAFMREAAIWPQIILYDVADIARFVALNRRGLFAVRRPALLLVLGRYTPGQRSAPEDLDPLLAALGDLRGEVEWGLCAFGPREIDCVSRALAKGGHGRVGFENNLELPDGRRAGSSSELVALAADAAAALGRPVMDAAALRRAIAGWR